ncbi:schlafen family member 13-like [Paramuricea clavata]|uniref:Schlafen family member 13-like n=1 Tax=Paramuricea clavata TaxID=317549 RepID=A0A6S7KHY0_PARCT|nr:schlafen family member 13-like [Paramuricea clavata]
MHRSTNRRPPLIIPFSPTDSTKKRKEQVTSHVCALLNSDGGDLIITFPNQNYEKKDLDQRARTIEQWINTLIGNITMLEKVQFGVEPDQIVIKIEGFYNLITVDYNMFLPSHTQINRVLPNEALKKVKDFLFGEEMMSMSEELPAVQHVFVQGEEIKLTETYNVQFKQLEDAPAERTTLADRVIGKGNKILQCVSAFANYRGGVIYVGVDDEHHQINGEVIPAKERESIVTKFTNKINKMIWLGLEDGPRKGESWDIHFHPVSDKTGRSVESERSHEMADRDNSACAKSTSALQCQRPIGRIPWSSICNRKNYYRVNGVLIRLINDGSWETFWVRLEEEQANCAAHGVKLVILSKKITAYYKRGYFEEAQRSIEEYRSGIAQSEDEEISETREFLLNSGLERSRGNIRESYEHGLNGLALVEKIPTGMLVVRYYSNLATVITILLECDGENKKILKEKAIYFFQKAVEHLEDANDFLPSKFDQEQKVHINLAFLHLGCSFASHARADRRVEDSEIEEAVKHLNAAEKSVNKGYAMTGYRVCQFLLARSVLFYRRSQNLKPDEIERKEDLLKSALNYSKQAKEFATQGKFVEMLESTSKHVNFFHRSCADCNIAERMLDI